MACYNLIISNRFYSERWLKILNMMLEKGKGPFLGKLRAMKSLEEYLQLLMIFFVNERMTGVIEMDEIIFKGNYG